MSLSGRRGPGLLSELARPGFAEAVDKAACAGGPHMAAAARVTGCHQLSSAAGQDAQRCHSPIMAQILDPCFPPQQSVNAIAVCNNCRDMWHEAESS